MEQYQEPGFVARIHLKTGDKDQVEKRKKELKTKKKKDRTEEEKKELQDLEDNKMRKDLFKYCLHREENDKTTQYVAIGWSKYFADGENLSFEEYYERVKEEEKKKKKKMPAAVNLFHEAEENCLFWTRDLDGYYWICRARGKAEYHLKRDMDIGAVVPVEAYNCGLEAPGQIRAKFTRPRGQTTERIDNKKKENEAKLLVEYSKRVFNEHSSEGRFPKENIQQGDDFLNNLPEFDLEELVISYLQITGNYYVLSNSIANKSTTIKIECELRHREDPKKAVVQVKAAGEEEELLATDYKRFIKEGYYVYLFCPHYKDDTDSDPEFKEHPEWKARVIEIKREELVNFVNDKKKQKLLPDNIMKWKKLFEDKSE